MAVNDNLVQVLEEFGLSLKPQGVPSWRLGSLLVGEDYLNHILRMPPLPDIISVTIPPSKVSNDIIEFDGDGADLDPPPC